MLGANITDLPPPGCAQSASDGQWGAGQAGQPLGAEQAQLLLGSGTNKKVHNVRRVSGKGRKEQPDIHGSSEIPGSTKGSCACAALPSPSGTHRQSW